MVEGIFELKKAQPKIEKNIFNKNFWYKFYFKIFGHSELVL